MGELMRQIADRLHTFQVNTGYPDFQAVMEPWAPDARGWDVPKLNKRFMKVIEAPVLLPKKTQTSPGVYGMNESLRHCPNAAYAARTALARQPH